MTAERDGKAPLRLTPRLLARPAHVAAARLFERDLDRVRHTTSHNVRKLLEARELLGEPIRRSLARALVHVAKDVSVDEWITRLASEAAEGESAAQLEATLRAGLAPDVEPGPALVLEALGTRAFEEEVWKTIALLAHGEFRQKNDADGIRVNRGKTGGAAAELAGVALPRAARSRGARRVTCTRATARSSRSTG